MARTSTATTPHATARPTTRRCRPAAERSFRAWSTAVVVTAAGQPLAVVGASANTTGPIGSRAVVVDVCVDCMSTTRPVSGSIQKVVRLVCCTEIGIDAGSASARTPNGSRPPLCCASSAIDILPGVGVTDADVVAW